MKPELSFEQWYKTVPASKNDTSSYNLRRAYELAPREELNKFANDPKAHLRSVYKNKNGVYEFMKSKQHPTIQEELNWYNSNEPEAVSFKSEYLLEDAPDANYYQYRKRNVPNYIGIPTVAQRDKTNFVMQNIVRK